MSNNNLDRMEEDLYQTIVEYSRVVDGLVNAVNVRNQNRVEEKRRDDGKSDMRKKSTGIIIFAAVAVVMGIYYKLVLGLF